MGTVVRMEIGADIEVGTTTDTLLPRDAFDGMTLIQMGVAKVLHADLDTHQLHAAHELIDEIENLSRQLDAAQVKVFQSIDRTGVYSVDGHRGAKPMIANAGKLSGAEAAARQRRPRC